MVKTTNASINCTKFYSYMYNNIDVQSSYTAIGIYIYWKTSKSLKLASDVSPTVDTHHAVMSAADNIS